MKIETPCVGICKLKDNVCVGCGRNVYQIKIWTHMEAADRKRIMDNLQNKAKEN